MNGNGFSAKNGHSANGHRANGHDTNGHSANGHSNGHGSNGHGSNGHSPLGHARRGFRGRIHAIEVTESSGGLSCAEVETRLIELGFMEGAVVEILHEGAFGRDPIAVRVNQSTIALRRREAMSIFVS